MKFLHKKEAVMGFSDIQTNTIDPRGGIQFMDCEGEEQVWVTDCDSLGEIYDSVIKMIMEKRNKSFEEAAEIFESITVDFAFCGCPVDEYDEELTPDTYTKKVTKAEYVQYFYEEIEILL